MRTLFIIMIISFAFLKTTAQYGIGQDENPSNGQEKANKGQYEEFNDKKVHPYTIFVKTKENFNLFSEINNIENILNDEKNPLRGYYEDIYTSGLTPFDHDDTFQIGGHIKYETWEIVDGINKEITIDRRKGVSKSSKMCKNAAFVYLIGVEAEGKSLRRSSHPDTISLYNAFKTRAIQRLQYMNVKTVTSVDFMQYRNKELIHYLQAYDMLKTAEMLAFAGVPGYNFTQNEKDQLEIIKYNLQLFARNIYRKANNIVGGEKIIDGGSFIAYRRNNHTIMAASAVGLAAVVLNDCGHYGYKPNWHPERWAHTAHYLISETMWDNKLFFAKNGESMSKRDTIAGYAEGPLYFRYAFETATPFFRAFSNFVPKNFDPRKYTYRSITNWVFGSEYVRNYNYDSNYFNLYEWHFKITQPDDYLPAYDASRFNVDYGIFNVIVGTKPTNEYNYYSPTSYGSGMDLDADYVAYGKVQPSTLQDAEHNVAYKASGDLILRSPYGVNKYNSHYLRIGAKSGTAINGGSHEHADLSSFIITAGHEILCVDPGYFSYGIRKLTNKPHHHNLIMVQSIIGEPDGPGKTTEAKNMGQLLSIPSLTKSFVESRYQSTDFERNIEMYKIDNEHYYYVMTDFVDRFWENPQKTYIWCMNGNGNQDEGTCLQDVTYDSKIKWVHPCSVRDTTWNLQTFSAVKGGIDSVRFYTGYDLSKEKKLTIHQQLSEDYIANSDRVDVGMSSKQNVGYHTRLKVYKKSNELTFLNVFWPYKCNETPPVMTKTENNNFASITINNINGDDIVHHAKLSINPVNQTNPFNYSNCNAVLSHNAEISMLKLSRSNSINYGNCTSNTRFRIASIDQGTFLTYNDTNFICTERFIKTAYELIGKYKYQGYIENETGSNLDVTYFLPDLEPQYDMKATDLSGNELTYTYENAESKITITFPDGVTSFYFTLVDPCLASCFFPSTQETIDSIFDFNTGTTEHLGHDLDIVLENGHLKITEGSKMEICSDFVLINHDSITMLGKYKNGDEKLPLYTQYGENGSSVTIPGEKEVNDRYDTEKSMIIIKEDAGLVLMPESYTHIGANSTILVKKGGTLLIKEHSYVEIGDSNFPGYAEIIAEDGAYVCIEPNADIHFYSNPDDSTDKNIFYVFNPSGDTIYLIGGGIKTTGAIDETNPDGGNGKFMPDSIFGGSPCIGFCNIKNVNTPHGINNRDFGWANINYPKAVAQIVDTFCYGDNITANALKTLNETKWHFKVCECDYPSGDCISPFTNIPKNGYDTVRINQYNLSDGYTFNEGTHYKVRFAVENDCHETDIEEKIIYISQLPEAVFDLPTDACPGIGSLYATNGQNSNNELSYKWTISMLGQDNFHPDDESAYYHEKSFSYTGETQDSFNFPNFRLYGNSQYEVELKVSGFCGSSSIKDTVNVPYAVYIEQDEATIYFDGYGDSSVQLNGSIYGFSTFQWSPTNYLSNSSILNPISSPPGSISYILSASGAGCADADTINISTNVYANAGSDKTLCKGDSSELGFSGKTIPANMYIDWKPTTNMDDSTIVNPTVLPEVTTKYTMNIRLNSDNSLVESDEVTVYVDSAVSPSYLVDLVEFYDDSVTFFFENDCVPYLPTTSYTWTFGDSSDTSNLVNVYHTFYKQAVDTYFVVCLTSSTTCSDSTYCDTIFYLADSNDWEFWIPQVSPVPEMTEPESSYLIGNIPNPFKDQTTIKYQLAENTLNAEIVIFNMFGKHVKTIKLKPNSETYNLDWSAYTKGIYSYSLLIDGLIKDSKKMIKL